MTPLKNNDVTELYKAILSLENEEECAGFFKDLLTDTELSSMAQRFMVAKILKHSQYREV